MKRTQIGKKISIYKCKHNNLFIHFCTFKKRVIQMSTYNPSWTLKRCLRGMGQNNSSTTTKGFVIEITVYRVEGSSE